MNDTITAMAKAIQEEMSGIGPDTAIRLATVAHEAGAGEVDKGVEFCEWAVEDSDTGSWETGCGDIFAFCHTWTSDDREGFDFCPFCGKPIRV